MKRIAISVICAVFFLILCLAIAFPLDESGHERAADICFYLAAWPVALVAPLDPGSDSPNVGLIRVVLYLGALLLSVSA